MTYTFATVAAAIAYVRESDIGSAEMLSARAADELIEWLAANGWSGLIQDDGVTVEFGR